MCVPVTFVLMITSHIWQMTPIFCLGRQSKLSFFINVFFNWVYLEENILFQVKLCSTYINIYFRKGNTYFKTPKVLVSIVNTLPPQLYSQTHSSPSWTQSVSIVFIRTLLLQTTLRWKMLCMLHLPRIWDLTDTSLEMKTGAPGVCTSHCSGPVWCTAAC